MTLPKTSIEFTTTPLFYWNYESDARVKNNQGGSSSGKTYAIEQVIFLRLIQAKKIATVVGQDIPNLKKGALRDFEDRILAGTPSFEKYIKSYNKTDRKFTFQNGSIMEFTSYQDFQDAKNGKRDILFLNEANGISWAIAEQLMMRTTDEVFIDYNPSAPFWVHDRLMGNDDVTTFYSNFTHNPFAHPEIVKYLLSLKETDPESWRVYGLGKTGAIRELVFPNVKKVDAMPRHLKRRCFGLDFGYRNDPTALIEGGLANERDVYLNERFYSYNMSTHDIHVAMKSIGIDQRTPIYADGADARAVDDLKMRGWNIIAADKGPGSILYGIELLNQYNLHVTSKSTNLLKEQQKYQFKVDRDGKTLNVPIDAYNHGWDAARYWGRMNLKPLGRTRHTLRGAVA